jgi:hypothetical protein
MKALRLFLFAGILTVLVFSACKKTEVKPTTINNYFAFNSVVYNLHQGMIVSEGLADTSANTYKYQLWLLSNDYSISDVGSIIGIGNGLYFSLYSSNPDSLPSGQYNYIYQSTASNTFDYGSTFLDYNIVSDSGYRTRIFSGYLNVQRTGTDTYNLDFNCNTEEDILVEGIFKGTIPFRN